MKKLTISTPLGKVTIDEETYTPMFPIKRGYAVDGCVTLEFDFPKEVTVSQAIEMGLLQKVSDDGS